MFSLKVVSLLFYYEFRNKCCYKQQNYAIDDKTNYLDYCFHKKVTHRSQMEYNCMNIATSAQFQQRYMHWISSINLL